MSAMERAGLAVLRRLEAERAHGLALKALNAGLVPRRRPFTSARLASRLFGMDLPNPVGMAAGFDKNAAALEAIHGRAGFGFIEVGGITPRPQAGNPRPRLFRLTEDRAVINRFGFNNEGMEAIGRRLAGHPRGRTGINLGSNKDSTDRAGDFVAVLRHCGPHADFATVNVSSPNTEKLRDLQGRAALSAILERVMAANAELARPLPILLKIAPELGRDELAEVAEVAERHGLAGIIATNTTLSREGLRSPNRGESGGLSGQPLFEMATRSLAHLSTVTDLPLVGVGGISSAEQAYAKIRAGASALQLYTALVYGGIGLVTEIARGLDRLLARDGFATLADAIGTDRGPWL
ncbi:quinone-dependent dihydroorotate dehydrogenase [Histidinibacterium lentulum]|uniref:Dihydroorotate dehydrogenase (quinone) n=1 Tax=Histidinibacterium lentulum TaxID=2480588 RepID=A0A3N2QWB3_9RHOB|nr:quinone-dependent dihydroorotate dehydrogenase [Histidinibacterium lentulum]ROT99476.1 quinone-dependent dihydroorotate dehydrogenase [Histidinibacterium lentulum]